MFGSVSRSRSSPLRAASVLLSLGALVFTVLHFVDAQKIPSICTSFSARHRLSPTLGSLYRLANFKNGSAVDPGYEAQYPPSTYVLLLPLLLISWSSITIMLATANIGAGALLIALLRRQFLPDFGVARTFSIGAAFFLSMPFQANLLHGQISLLALAAFPAGAERADTRALCAWRPMAGMRAGQTYSYVCH